MIATAFIVGKISTDLEIKNNVLNFTVSRKRDNKDKRTGNYEWDHYKCVAFGRKAEYIANHTDRGKYVIITAEPRTGSYRNEHGQSIKTHEYIIEKIDIYTAAGYGQDYLANNSNQNRAQDYSPAGAYEMNYANVMGQDIANELNAQEPDPFNSGIDYEDELPF